MVFIMAKKKKIDLRNLEPEEQLKYEIAGELGLLDKVMSEGWKSLSAKETGRIGGLMTKKKKEMKEKLQKEEEERESLMEELL
nr:small, acid-soluble spore protein, alpha/beta type [Lachnoclostridium sp. An138]